MTSLDRINGEWNGQFRRCWEEKTTRSNRMKFTLLQSIILGFNPLSPNSDQHRFSPNNIHTLSRNKVMRLNEVITKEKMPRSFIKVSQLILKGNVWRSVWRICMWILGLKGLRDIEIQCILRVNQVCI